MLGRRTHLRTIVLFINFPAVITCSMVKTCCALGSRYFRQLIEDGSNEGLDRQAVNVSWKKQTITLPGTPRNVFASGV